ncbi:MAG: hypoxanthine phosphoribosyltransferase [Clostridia bacterium]|nr:hypoxanthine phosphoribosyltransferase [Clostridia bacterium]MBR0026058.1 hypoxanthine phosphoribosyltransferase [Clostridia bacterium]
MTNDISHILLTEEQIAERVKELGEEITRDYYGKEPIVVGILKGAVPFFADLTRHMDCQMEMDFMALSSYGGSTKSSGIVRIGKDLDRSIEGRHVIIVEDIMDSGLTLSHLTKVLSERKPASVKIACLLDKPSRRECDITPDYCGFEVPNEFVVGCGLDYDGFYRNLPYVGVLKPEVYA